MTLRSKGARIPNVNVKVRRHVHTPRENIILDPDGRDSGERWVECIGPKGCGARLGIKKPLPFATQPLAFADQITRVA